MATISSSCFNNIAQYLNTPVGKISKNDNLYTRVNNSQSTTGIINILFSLLEDSQSSLAANDIFDEGEIHQWLEYAIVYAGNANNSQNVYIVLKEINSILSTKTYLIGNRLTICDVFLYHVIFNIMARISNLDKERFINVSRWFDNIQQDSAIRQKNYIVDFSTNYLANIVPARR